MLSSRTLKQVVGSISLMALFCATMPVTAAELTPTKAMGSVSIAGPVQLRGISISREGTIFTGDQLSVGTKGYAKVMLVQGHKLELDQLTDVTVSEQGSAVQLALKSGNLGFTTAATGSVQIVAGNYEITSDKPMSGNVAVIGSGYIGVHLLSGAATMRNLFTKQTVRIPGGEERMVSFAKDPSQAPVAQLASNDALPPLPAPVPTMPPVPAPQQSAGNRGLSKTGWAVVMGTFGGAAVAVAILATRNPASPTTNAAAQTAVIANSNAATTGANNGAASSAAAASAATSAAAAFNASSASNKGTLAAQAQTIASQSQANQQQFVSLQASLASLTAQLESTSDNSTLLSLNAQIIAINININALIAAQNALNQQLLALILQGQSLQIPGLPSSTGITTISTVTLPNASNSIP